MKDYKPYNPQETEDQIYKLWEESGLFNPDVCIEKGVAKSDAEPFSIALPPPNVTGTLHTGHALMLAIEDAMIRYHRMKGDRTLWIPGTDHAAIATQSKVEKIISKEGKNKQDLGREEFLKRVESYASESHDTIVHQVRKMGASIDWSREAFTLDEKRSYAVRVAFKLMYDAGLIYRGDRVINWDPKGQTTVSDDEVTHEEAQGTLYTFKYNKDFPISIATTRPETKFGDTAVAVNPDDDRYKELVGKDFETSFCGVKLSIKIIADRDVDPKFGTGAVGVTPAHSQVDYQISLRHELPLMQVINEYGRMNLPETEFNDLKTLEARQKVIEALKAEGLMEKEEQITMSVPKAERSGGVIEALPKKQWFVDVNKKFSVIVSKNQSMETGEEATLKELMQKAVKNKEVTILPTRFEQEYFHWIDNLRDWCISRQLWYGHRIPVWYKGEEIYVGIESPEGEGWIQDPDTLDTWFSSGLWTFSTLGWPEETSDFDVYHPTSVLETGYDILFFWVARMILMSEFLVGEIPFKTVYLHGLVRDEKGRKMSKSLDNALDPLHLIEQFGTDALRLAMIFGVGVGNDSVISTEKVKGMRNFANKLFNINRFVMMSVGEGFEAEPRPKILDRDLTVIAQSELIVERVTKLLEEFRLSDALQESYSFIWDWFASDYIESVKPLLENGTSEEKQSVKWALMSTLCTQLKLLHPFMPFVTEHIYQEWKEKAPDWAPKDFLMVESWPSLSSN